MKVSIIVLPAVVMLVLNAASAQNQMLPGTPGVQTPVLAQAASETSNSAPTSKPVAKNKPAAKPDGAGQVGDKVSGKISAVVQTPVDAKPAAAKRQSDSQSQAETASGSASGSESTSESASELASDSASEPRQATLLTTEPAATKHEASPSLKNAGAANGADAVVDVVKETAETRSVDASIKAAIEQDKAVEQKKQANAQKAAAGTAAQKELKAVRKKSPASPKPKKVVGGAVKLSKPESVGMSTERFKRLTRYLQAEVKAGRLPGAVIAIARRGKTVYHQSFGHLDEQSKAPMPVNAIFDLSRLTQPITAVGALMLLERGQWLLSDALGEHLKAFQNVPVSLLDLLRQSSGLATEVPAVSFVKNTVLSRRPMVKHSVEVAASFTGQKFAQALASAYQVRPPGQTTLFDFSYDALGLAIESVTGGTLGSFFLSDIFIPLDLWDTGFYAPTEASKRVVRPPADADLDASLITGWVPVRDPRTPISFECAGACLSSTAGDYLRFAQMLLDGGKVGKKRLLSRTSVEFMTRDRLAGDIENRIAVPGELRRSGPSRFGYGLGVSVRSQRAGVSSPGSVGEFGLASPTGPFFWVDPREKLAVVLMALVPQPERRLKLQRQVRALVLQTIAD